ncbi:MAG: hypothetical protein ACO3EK_20080 [Alphaproteobacteria bacterium]
MSAETAAAAAEAVDRVWQYQFHPEVWVIVVGLVAASTTLGVVLGMRAAPRVATHALSRLIGAMMAVAAAIIAARLASG